MARFWFCDHVASPGSLFCVLFRRCILASVVTLPGQWRHLELVLVSVWLPTASWRERVVKVLSFLCRSNYYDPIWILITNNNGFFGYLDCEFLKICAWVQSNTLICFNNSER